MNAWLISRPWVENPFLFLVLYSIRPLAFRTFSTSITSFYEKCNQYSCTLYYTGAVALTWMITDSAAYLNGWLIRAAQQKFTVPQFKQF